MLFRSTQNIQPPVAADLVVAQDTIEEVKSINTPVESRELAMAIDTTPAISAKKPTVYVKPDPVVIEDSVVRVIVKKKKARK